ncbi:hypothetical protein C1701_16875 [Actinoalloteichus sp. AHMU CJ021]|nr:hypothetical protein C1701_16875 [Actinoalloteichus sp. AHMU CJ021]
MVVLVLRRKQAIRHAVHPFIANRSIVVWVVDVRVAPVEVFGGAKPGEDVVEIAELWWLGIQDDDPQRVLVSQANRTRNPYTAKLAADTHDPFAHAYQPVVIDLGECDFGKIAQQVHVSDGRLALEVRGEGATKTNVQAQFPVSAGRKIGDIYGRGQCHRVDRS